MLLKSVKIFLPFAAVLLLVLSACTNSKTAARQRNAQDIDDLLGDQTSSQKSQSVDQAVTLDPCAARLHDIGGAILMFYLNNRELPQQLEDLQPVADIDITLNFACPVSGKPYMYVPGGLGAPGRTKRIIVCDPAPSHNGRRWCLLMVDSGPGKAQSVEVLSLTEGLFRTYLPEEP